METQNKIASIVKFAIFLLLICYVCDISGQWYPVHRRSYVNYENINDKTLTDDYDDTEYDTSVSRNRKWILQPQNSMKLRRPPSNYMSKSDNTVPNDNFSFLNRIAEPLRLKVEAAPACTGKTYCENVTNYPSSIVEEALKSEMTAPVYENIDGLDTIQFRFGYGSSKSAPELESDTEALCDSNRKIVYPKSAERMDNDWMFVVNVANFTQGVYVETCEEEGSACKVLDGGAAGYVTSCEQKYTFRQLTAITSDGQLVKDHFRFPTSCCCSFRFVANALRFRDKRLVSPQSKRNFN